MRPLKVRVRQCWYLDVVFAVSREAQRDCRLIVWWSVVTRINVESAVGAVDGSAWEPARKPIRGP